MWDTLNTVACLWAAGHLHFKISGEKSQIEMNLICEKYWTQFLLEWFCVNAYLKTEGNSISEMGY